MPPFSDSAWNLARLSKSKNRGLTIKQVEPDSPELFSDPEESLYKEGGSDLSESKSTIHAEGGNAEEEYAANNNKGNAKQLSGR